MVFPEASFVSNGRTYPTWDGRRILATGRDEAMCRFSPNAVLDYRVLRAAGAHPANMWWFYRVLPLVYDGDRLAADNFDEYLFGLRDLRYPAPTSPSPASTRRSKWHRRPGLVQACCKIWRPRGRSSTPVAAVAGTNAGYVTQGPQILQWTACNTQMEHPWQTTRGAQRVRLRFEVASDAGLREVRVHDANFGLPAALRRRRGPPPGARIRAGARQAALRRAGGDRQPRPPRDLVVSVPVLL